MTKEERLDWLCRLRSELVQFGIPPKERSKFEEALSEEIKGLSAEPCNDCINRSELLKALDTWDKFGYRGAKFEKLDRIMKKYLVPYIRYEDAVKAIKGMPSVPSQPKTGHWTTDGHCSYCGQMAAFHIGRCAGNAYTEIYRSNYCPNCGIEMKKEDEDE